MDDNINKTKWNKTHRFMTSKFKNGQSINIFKKKY